MRKLLITGAGGQLGRELAAAASSLPEWQLFLSKRADLDICNPQAVDQVFGDGDFDACINCAAYTAVDRAESEAKAAEQVNVEGVANLARAAARHQAQLVHFSTDYVYHNGQNQPLTEEAATSPKSIYALTKLTGENQALNIHPHTLVIRTSWVYSSYGKNFVKTMLRLGAERNSLNVVYDQVGSPTYAADLAKATLRILTTEALPGKRLGGVFNYSNEGVTSWYDFAHAIFEIAGVDCQVNPITTVEYPTPASRPPYSVMNKSGIKERFGLQIPHWRESLKECLSLLAK